MVKKNTSMTNKTKAFVTKFTLLAVMGMLTFFMSVLVGYLGGGAGLYIALREKFSLEYFLMTLALTVWLIVASSQHIGKSILVASMAVFAIEMGLYFTTKINILEFEFSYFSITFALTVIGLIIFNAGFLIFRFALALIKILFSKSRTIEILGVVVITFAAILGSLIAIYAAIQLPDSEVKRIFSISNEFKVASIKVISIFCGISFNMGLLLGAWRINYLRNVPWSYPDLLRNWALTVGSWSGHSLEKSDLSGVDLKGVDLANANLLSCKLYRTCFQGAIGLARARIDSRYMDLEIPKIQELLIQGYSKENDFSRLNLRGAYLQNADLRGISFIDADLSDADLKNADLQGALLVRTQVAGADFTKANLTGICIKDWNVNEKTSFSNVLCDYVYRELGENAEPTDRYPEKCNFEPREFESIYQEVGNIVELIFKEGVNWRALSFSMQKLQLEDDGLGLELKGVERRGDRWVVKVTHNENISKREVEHRLLNMYEEMKLLLVSKEQQINQLLGIATDQAEALKEISRKPFGNSFVITGSTITNLVGSGQINYTEAADQIRSIIASSVDPSQVIPILRSFIAQLDGQKVATSPSTQQELIQQLILSEAEIDTVFKQFLLQQGQQIINAMPTQAMAAAVQVVIAQLRG